MRQSAGNPNLVPEEEPLLKDPTHVLTWQEQGAGEGGKCAKQKGEHEIRTPWWVRRTRPHVVGQGWRMGGGEDPHHPDDGKGRRCSQRSRKEIRSERYSPPALSLSPLLSFPLKF